MEDASIVTSVVGGVCMLALVGEHDEFGRGAVGVAIANHLDASPPALLIDVSRLTFADSTLIRTLLLSADRARDDGIPLAFVIPPGNRMRKILELKHLIDRFAVYPDVPHALAAVAA